MSVTVVGLCTFVKWPLALCPVVPGRNASQRQQTARLPTRLTHLPPCPCRLGPPAHPEFNLLYDRGIKFGLDGGRIESIMVSAPPLIAWKYNVVPQPGSPEEEMLKVLQQPREWA